jgi:hypothetical protein
MPYDEKRLGLEPLVIAGGDDRGGEVVESDHSASNNPDSQLSYPPTI